MEKYERITNSEQDYYEYNGSPADVYRKLVELEDKIENGTLIVLPCIRKCKTCYQVIYEDNETKQLTYITYGLKELDRAQARLKEVQGETSDESFDGGYHEYAKEKHEKRVAENPDRIAFAIKQFKNNNIEYTLKNEATGHFHCRRKSDDKLFQFYAGTGKIVGVSNKRGIHEFIKILSN